MAYITKTAVSVSAGIVLLLMAASSASVADNVYKWVDDNGNVHFGQRPPQNRSSEVINTRSPRSFGQHLEDNEISDTPIASPEEDDAQLTGNEENGQAQEQVFTKDAKLCAQAREYREILMSNPIVRKEGKAMTIEEKNEELKRVEEVISIHC